MIYVTFHKSNPALKNPFCEHSPPSPAFWQIWGKDYTFWQQEPTSPLISHLAPCHWKNALFFLPEVLHSRAGPLCPMKVLSIIGCFSSDPSHPHPNAKYLWGQPWGSHLGAPHSPPWCALDGWVEWLSRDEEKRPAAWKGRSGHRPISTAHCISSSVLWHLLRALHPSTPHLLPQTCGFKYIMQSHCKERKWGKEKGGSWERRRKEGKKQKKNWEKKYGNPPAIATCRFFSGASVLCCYSFNTELPTVYSSYLFIPSNFM